MNRAGYIFIFIGLIIGFGVGYILSDLTKENDEDASFEKAKKVAYWVAPMDPNFRRPNPGKSPMGMALIPVYEEEEASGHDVGFTISPNILANLGVKTEAASVTSFKVAIDATGRALYDESRISRIQLRTEGWVEELSVKAIGETVRKDDPLFTYYSPTIAAALTEYGQTLSGSSKHLQQLAYRKLIALGLSDKSISGARSSKAWTAPIVVRAPRSGVITTLGVRAGGLSAKNTLAFEITDPSEMWLIADVFQSQAADVAIGQQVTVSGSGRVYSAQIDYIYPELDADMQTVRLRIRLANKEGAIRAGQYFKVRIFGRAQDHITVPSSAVIRLGGGDHVIVAMGHGAFFAAQVITGKTSTGRTVILAGLEAGENVVVSGQFMLDSESSFTGAALRLLDKEEGN